MPEPKEPKVVKVSIEPEYVMDINTVLLRTRGKDLETIAREDPSEAYRITRLALLTMAGDVNRLNDETALLVSADDSVSDDPVEVTYRLVDDRVPEFVTEPTRLELFQLEVPDGFGQEARHAPGRGEHLIMAVTVEPPDLA